MKNNESYRLIPYLFENIMYALPTNSSKRFKRHIRASLIAYITEDYEFDNITEILENLPLENFEMEETDYADLAQDLLIGVIRSMENVLKVIAKNPNKIDGVPHYCLVMQRLQATYESCLILLRNGYYIEASPLFRLIFEQVAWAYSIADKDIGFIEKSIKTKSVKHLNDLIQGSSRIYEKYSNEAHMNLSETGQFLYVDENNNVYIKKRSGQRSKERNLDLVFLSRLYILSIEKVTLLYNLSEYPLNSIELQNYKDAVTVEEFIEASKKTVQISYNYLSKGEFITREDMAKGYLEYIDDMLI